jgi:hypothetical protein
MEMDLSFNKNRKATTNRKPKKREEELSAKELYNEFLEADKEIISDKAHHRRLYKLIHNAGICAEKENDNETWEKALLILASMKYIGFGCARDEAKANYFSSGLTKPIDESIEGFLNITSYIQSLPPETIIGKAKAERADEAIQRNLRC